ncbi:hypothetical protein F4553_005377 [Allocatelliglobosispora scoriae]|uniref:Uncharacterized protein n=1 Tax=Allocatelliglobosispora scoriae TaxID=643052 RepID=A0A841BWX6_9ACTN|nr:hypothetical protein [Allocatelliglobosispora scoriae]MBB5871998.1 hypothetical protein [Allocatelliglobosispora scoriae]
MQTIKARDLEPGMTFIDPGRNGRLPATVIAVVATVGGVIHVTLDDDTRWKDWAASYPLDQDLELVQ